MAVSLGGIRHLCVTAKYINPRRKREMVSNFFKVLFSVLFVLSTAMVSVHAEDLFLFDLVKKGDSIVLENGKNITKRKGYDNQPYFTSDSKKILYSSEHSKLTDIYEYDVESGETVQLTKTGAVPEYSPVPDAENKTFTAVTENTTPNQTVWRYDRETGKSTWALASHEPVGYYIFNRRGEALLWLRYAYSMQFVNPDKEISKFVVGNAAPSRPLIVPGTDNFSFVHRQMNGEAWIKIFNSSDYSITPVAPLIDGKIDYCWSADGNLFMGSDSKLFQWIPGKSEKWKEIADLSKSNVEGITRLFVSPDNRKIVIVGADHLD